MTSTPAATANRMLASLPKDVLAAVIDRARPDGMVQGRVFAEPGQVAREVHFVTSGAISLVTMLIDGDAVEAGMVGREGALGAHAVLTGLPAFTRAICQVDGTVLTLEGSVFRSLVQDRPDVRIMVDRYVEGAANQAQQAIACRAWHAIEHRFARWLLTACDHAGRDRIALTQEFMAHMLGVNRTTVSGIAGRFKAEGLIRYSRGQIAVKDRAALERAACECLPELRQRWDLMWGPLEG